MRTEGQGSQVRAVAPVQGSRKSSGYGGRSRSKFLGNVCYVARTAHGVAAGMAPAAGAQRFSRWHLPSSPALVSLYLFALKGAYHLIPFSHGLVEVPLSFQHFPWLRDWQVLFFPLEVRILLLSAPFHR